MAGGSGICRHVLRTAAIFATATTFAACSASRPSVQPIAPISSAPPATSAPAASQIGVASWYGPGFNGHATSSGEIYNQDDFTAASLSCPLGSRVMVTNLDNGRSVEVRINDHGPYVKGRKIDLSRKAATVLGMVGPGTARVRLDLLSVPSVSAPIGSALRYFVQVGSFANSSHADHLRSRLAEYYSDVRVDQVDAGSHRFYRVRMGAFPTRVEAQARAEKTSHFGLPIIILSE
ncbi:MAG TPA: septal ring lytic transglycosylase RlpA family protein [Candidatus Binataceae bacterium]|nr:septal ring lytic transglycosylase RlpA family protein [Candidatus Binataceae bacterium]